MAISDLKQLASAFEKAATSGDLDWLEAMYDAEAVFVTGPDSEPARGPAAIREVMAGLLAAKPSMKFEHVYMYVHGDLALMRGKWTLTSRAADGSESTQSGSSVEVARKGSDGLWRYVIDHPWGAD
jgi:ketosteroid isomerase-like protein